MHYYGDVVRRLLLAGAFVMLVTLPFVNALLPFPAYISLLAIIGLCVVAGLINPIQRWVVVLTELTVIAAAGIFEYYAVVYYLQYSFMSWAFVVNQLLALNFLAAVYYNTKTVRGVFMR